MSKYVLFLLAIFIIPLPANAQSSRQDFRKKLAQATTDSQKLNIYKAVYDFYADTSHDSTKVYMEEGLQEFTRTGNKHAQGRMLLFLTNIYNERGLLVIAREKGEDALNIFTELGQEAYIGKAHNAIGNADSYLGNYPEAFRHFLAALKSFERVGDTLGLINTYLELGAANDFNGNNDKALDYYNKALDLYKHIPETVNIVYLYNNIGLSHARKGRFDEALKYFEKAELIGRKPEYTKARLPPLTNLGKVYNAKGDNKKALEYLYQAKDLSKTLKTREPLCRVLLEIGLIESKFNPPNLFALQEGLQIAKEMDIKRLQSEYLTALADAADRAGDYKAEVSLLKQARGLRDSIFTIDKAKDIANLQSEYDLKRTSSQLAALEKSEQRNKQKKNFIIIIAVVLAGTLLTMLIFYTRSRRLNKELSIREQDLEKANAVKDRLFSIIGHDLKGPVGNIPTLLSMYKSEDSNEDEKKYMLKAMEESSQAALETLDKLLSWGAQQIKGNVFNPSVLVVESIMEHKLRLLGVMAANKNITIVNNIPPNIRVYADENHFKFIMRNLISNAVKFTQPGGMIEISADQHEGDGFVIFSVKDNGVGMGQEMQQHIFEPYNESLNGTANEAGTSIGLMLCKEFIIQNGGNIWVKSEKEHGTTFTFTVRGA